MPETVLYVPGFPSSHLKGPGAKRFFLTLNVKNIKSSLLHGPDDRSDDQVRPDEPIRATVELPFFDLGKAAASLYDILDAIGCRTVPFGWDWRRPVWEDAADTPGNPTLGVGARLRAAIEDEHKKAGGPITLIAHSGGGFVVRALLEAHPGLARRLRRLITFGVPWAGAVKAFQEVCGKGGIQPVLSAKRSQQILCRAWAAIDTLPPAAAAALGMITRAGAGKVSPLVDTAWLAALPAAERAAVESRVRAAAGRLAGRSRTFDLGGEALEIVNVVGWGEPTVDLAEVKADGSSVKFFARSGVDPADRLGYEGGDATAPRRSAAWLQPSGKVRLATYHVPVGWLPAVRKHPHATLWRNPGGRNLLRHLLGGQPLEPFAYAALDSGDTSPGAKSTAVRVRAVALDAAGQPLPGAQLRTLDLTPGPQVSEPFDPAHEGRHVMAVPRARIRSLKSNVGRNFHLAVEITWQGGRSRPIRFGFSQNN